jgi:CheY-like chemotaxis protein
MGNILVVDDEEDARYLVKQILEDNGYNVIEARNGRECLKKIREKKPDLILLDIMMPGLDGWEVLGEIQRDSDLRYIPVTMFTVKPLTPETIRRKEVEGLVNYIVKPFSNEGLIAAVSKTLDDLSEAREIKEKLEQLSGKAAGEYDSLSRKLILHKNFLSILKGVVKDRKEDGTMDDILSFEDVLKSELKLIDSCRQKKRELESLLHDIGQTT